MVKRYFLRVLIAIDQLINTVLGGQPDETMSSALWRNKNRSWYHWLAWAFVDMIALLFGDKNHCQSSHEAEQSRKHLYM